MTTITKTAKPALLARTWALANRAVSHVHRGDMFVLGLAVGITAFGPGASFALAFLAPYVLVQLGLWVLFRARKAA